MSDDPTPLIGPPAADPRAVDPAPRRDLDDGLRFVHAMGMQTKRDVGDLASKLFALLEEMVSRGQVDLTSYDERRQRLQRAEDERTVSRAHVQIAPPVDKYALTDLPVIDCVTRLPLCQARCCTLAFPLSFQDLDERVVAWDYRRPYQIRQRGDGYCTHCEPDTKQCGVYDHRPGTCRSYDCRQDSRIWLDFERRIPAPVPSLAPVPESVAPAPAVR